MALASNEIILRNAVLSHSSLFEFAKYKGVCKGQYSASFIIEDEDQIKAIEELEAKFIKEKGKKPADFKSLVRKNKEGKPYVKAKTKFELDLVDGKLNKITKENNIFYDGCYVNARIGLWLNLGGETQCVCSNINAIQFAGDGEARSNTGSSVFEAADTGNAKASDSFKAEAAPVELDDEDTPF